MLFNGSLKLILSTNAILSGILFGLFTLAGMRIGGRLCGLGWGITMTFFPSNLMAHGLICTEIPAMFFAYLPLILYYFSVKRPPWLLLICGLSLGFTFMIRPPNITFVLALVVLFIVRRESWVKTGKHATWCLLGFVIFVLPFATLNYFRYGHFTPTPAKTGQLFTHRYQDRQYSEAKGRKGLADQTIAIMERKNADPEGDPYYYNSLMVKAWFQYFTAHPMHLWEDFLYNWYEWRYADNGHYYAYAFAKPGNALEFWKKAILLKFQTYYCLVSHRGIFGIYLFLFLSMLCWRPEPFRSALLMLLIIQTIFYMLIFAIGRFHFCVVPVLALFFVDFHLLALRGAICAFQNDLFRSLTDYYSTDVGKAERSYYGCHCVKPTTE